MRVAFICHGNICRSPMAEFYLKQLKPDYIVESRATHNDAIGCDMFYAAKEKLKKEGIPFTHHTATKLSRDDYDKFDYFLVMDTENFTNTMIALNGDPLNKVFRLLDFASLERDVLDPWYTGNFDLAFLDIKLGCDKFVEFLDKKNKD